MKRVTGVGGIFFTAVDQQKLKAWYERHLGIAGIFLWQDSELPSKPGYTIWNVFSNTSKMFESVKKGFVLNYRVDDLVPLFKALFLQARLKKARELDQQRLKTTNPDVITALDEQLEVFNVILREDWFQSSRTELPLSLRDLLTLERVEKLDVDTHIPERLYDEKFHLLQAPTLFLQDLHYYRGKCGVRDIPVSIAFMDIDHFKPFNREVGHTKVNLHVLPVFMRSVEASSQS